MASGTRKVTGFFSNPSPKRAGLLFCALAICPLSAPHALAQSIANEDLLLRGITDDDGLTDAERRRLLRAADRIVDDSNRSVDEEQQPLTPIVIDPAQPVQNGESVNPRTQPVANQVNIQDDPDPFAPVGIRVGTFILRPTVTQQIAHETDDDGTTRTSRTYSRTVFETEIESDWSRHQLNIGAEQVIDKTISGTGSEDPSTSVNADLRLDLTSTTTADIGFDYEFGRESQTDPNAVAGAEAQAAVHTFAAAASLSQQFSTWRGTATIDGGRSRYGDAQLSDGTLVSLSDRDADNYTVTMRAALETGSAYRPFVQGSVGQIIYDNTVDASGFERSSNTYGLRAGVTADFGEKLTGEFAIGYALRDIDDPRLSSIEGITVNGFATWSPQRGTDVLMGASTTLEDSTTADESGSIYYAATAEVVHQLRSNVSARVSGLVGWRDYVGPTPNETIIGAGAGFTWWLNRYVALDGGVTYEKTLSDGSADSDELFVGLGLKVQR